MIPYVQIRDKYSFLPKAIVEPSQCWFEVSYYELGQFEVYATASESNLNALKKGNFVQIPHRNYLWIITSVQYEFNSDGARMIDAKGFEAKYLLSQRIIYTPETIQGSLDESVCKLVNFALGPSANSYRKIKNFVAQRTSINTTIEETQTIRQALSEFVLPLIKSNRIGCESLIIDNQIIFRLKQGRDLSSSILFSQSMDNLISSTYFESIENKKTFCQVISTFKEKENTTEYVKQYPVENPVVDGNPQENVGLDRNEMTLASNISNKYIDENGNEVTLDLTNAQDRAKYEAMLVEAGKSQLAEKTAVVDFEAEIDLKYSNYEFEKDFDVGDIVKVRDEYFGYEATARILKYTFKQDASGYGEEADYGNE